MAAEGISEGERGGAWVLPRVPDRWWPWLKAALVALLAITMAVEFLGLRVNFERGLVRPFAHVGLAGWKSTDGVVTIRAPLTEEAIASGLSEGQTLVAVDGVAVGNRVSDMTKVDRLLVGPEGSRVVLTTRDSTGRVATHQVTRSERNADAIYAGSGISSRQALVITMAAQAIPDLFLLFVAAMLMRSRRRETVGLLFSVAFISLVLTGPATFSLYSSDWQVALGRVIGTAGMVALAVALLAFPDGRIEGLARKAALAVAMGLALLTAVFADIGENLFTLALFVASIAVPTIALFVRARGEASGAKRQQIRFALFGFATGVALLLASFLLNVIAPPQTAANTALWTWLFVTSLTFSSLAFIAIPGGLLLSLLRYRLYDVDTLISRSAAYGLMTVGFVAVFAGLENLLEQAAQTYLSDNAGKAAGAISAALAAGLIGPMHSRIHGWTERRFRKGLVAMRSELPREIDDLRETASFEELAAVVEPAIARGVNAEWVRLRPPDLLNAQDVDLRGELERPIATADGRVLSLLEVGPRPDGSPHGKDEREAIDALAEPLARALTVIERREAKERAIDRRIGALEAAIAKLAPARRQKPGLAN